MSLVLRTLVYGVLFIGFLLVYLPARVLARTGIHRPVGFGAAQLGGAVVCALGAALALWCVASFIRIGQGTPAPFDSPRRLVIRGPYRYLRNPMYMGAGLALAGAALFYGSAWLLAYALAFVLVFHVFVVLYEEPTLERKFGAEYEEYRRRVHRWRPTRAHDAATMSEAGTRR
jgi:protein-S-isoprenylcysteine O-methyltransferase Ste14